jgi:hypothetical protein
MTANEFVNILRSGSEKLRVDEVVINTGSQEIHGKGTLTVTKEDIKIQVTINSGENLPAFQSGIYTKRDTH